MLVSIIMPMYNAERYIGESIRSVREQTYRDWELFIVDDGSTDRSREKAEECAGKDPRIHIFSLGENRGIARARNFGIEKAEERGELLAFLDSDDRWDREKLELQVSFMMSRKCSFTYTGCELLSDSGEPLKKRRSVPPRVDYGTLLNGNVILCSSVMIDIRRLGKKGMSVRMPEMSHEDYGAWLDLLRVEKYAYGLDQALVFYRKSENSVSRNKIKTLVWTFDIFYIYQKLGLVKSVYHLFLFSVNTARKYLYDEKVT